ncbi:MAG: hypothetical protein HYW07_19145 [Candidatus Latescibacteria bacterium]|nr:hypothetical protein [Candidatus Latescibacterota bacterium]
MPLCGFPLRLVARHFPQHGLWQARRGPGQPLASGMYRCGGPSFAQLHLHLEEGAGVQSRLCAQLAARALHLVLRRFEDRQEIRELLAWLNGRQVPLRVVENHDLLLDLDGQTALLAGDVADPLGIAFDQGKEEVQAASAELLHGLELLLALGQHHLFQLLRGCSQRAALHHTLALYQACPPPEQARLHQLLEGRVLDSGNLFSLFLRRSTSPAADQSLRRWQDEQITWLLGQDLVDLPYDRQAAAELLKRPLDPDEKRFLLYALLRDYDRDLEQGNIARLAARARQAGQQLIFGRMSRAFHNQATLFADAVLLQPAPGWAELGCQLAASIQGSPFLQPFAEELRLLLESGAEVPLTQAEGACERFEEAVLEDQKQALLERCRQARQQVEDHGDELAGSHLPALATTPLTLATQQRLALVQDLRRALLAAPRRRAAYVIISQRPSPTGSHLLVKINEFEEPYLGKAENLRKLPRLAGDHLYSSPDYRWLRMADHWIEAIPLFIKEEVRLIEGRESTRTVVDIAGMEESFREEMADLWAQNLALVLDSEFLALARELMAGENPPTATEEAALGTVVATLYRQELAAIRSLAESEELPPYEALCQVLLEPRHPLLARAVGLRQQGLSWAEAAHQTLEEEGLAADFKPTAAHLLPQALQPRRPLPTLHVLTTQSAGMTEGYIRTWLEESMALYNAVEAQELHAEVRARQESYLAQILALGEQVIRELGIWVEVEETCAREQASTAAAVQRVIGRNPQVQEELSCLGALREYGEQQQLGEPAAVEECLRRNAAQLQAAALARVAQRNGQALQREADRYSLAHPQATAEEALLRVVEADEHYRQDLQAYMRFAARRLALEQLDQQHPQLHLQEQARTFLRRYQRLSKTTARKEVLTSRGLNHLAMDPLYAYQATGPGKRYHLLYTPSRVDLGERERESVESWSQWVGGADRAAAQVGRQVYSLINKSVRSFASLAEPEVLKTGENASMASHFAFSNALALMVGAARHGDLEEMGDQMSRRRDRLIHPAGEGYGGYCVPKDGLFLEFVLTLGRSEKLRQLGLPDEVHEQVADLAHQLLDRRDEFATQSEWEAWARALLPAGLPIFQLPRLTQVLEGLGQPELLDPYRVAAVLSARWGIHKMVAGAEHLNRFMPFFKAWLIRQGMQEAARRHPQVDAAAFVAVLSAEYKPDTQDGRFSVGMRKFEILAGTGDHLLHALDAEAQELAILLHQGYAALEARGRGHRLLHLLGLDPADQTALEQLRQLYPGHPLPAELRLVSPTGLSTQDLFSYTSDSALDSLAEEAQRELLAAGFSPSEIEANMRSHGPRLGAWAGHADLTAAAGDALAARLGGRLHALALRVLGPESSYEHALQGADVLDTGIPHRTLRELLADPARLCALMLEGNPHSGLVIVDGASGARRRALNRLDVMLWFAAGERLGRQPVYLSIGLGQQTVEGWRVQVRRLRRRAERLGQAITEGDQAARQLYARAVDELRQGQEAGQWLEEAEKLRRFGRDRERDHLIAQAQARLGRGLAFEELGFDEFLALGGLFLLEGAEAGEIRAYARGFEAGLRRLGGWPPASAWSLLHPRYWPQPEEFRQERRLESSNKAAEERPQVALEARRQLAARIARAQALNQRQAAFSAVRAEPIAFPAACQAALQALGPGDRPLDERAFGAFIGYARNALLALASLFHDEEHPAQTQGFIARLSQLFTGRQLELAIWRQISGGYEDIGDFGRLAQGVAEAFQQGRLASNQYQRRLHLLAQGAELFYILLAVEHTIEFTRQPADPGDPALRWRRLADFFAETLDDHFYDYRPWIYSRGIGFAGFKGENLYELAVERHAWLYRYLRFVVTQYTELRALPAAEQDLLLGNFLDGQEVEAIGAGAPDRAERAWRSYGQLRELAFIRNDGFPLPEVFAEFDPQLIHAQDRVNHLIGLPVGRTHYSRALREGPTLARQLEAQGRPGANLLISRHPEIVHCPGLPRPVVCCRSAHFYVDAATYDQALVRYKGLSPALAAAAARQIHPKGIRVAARFTSPVLAALLYPFHGDPLYTTGQLEDCGLPYTVQSLFHTWTTYDKAKYPDIFPPASGVEMPAEIDWLAAHTARSRDEIQVKGWIAQGLAGTPYTGLEAFAQTYPLVMIKDAAESGGRNARAFALRRLDGQLDAEQLRAAVDFVYQISLKHNAAIQEVIRSSPEYWATEEFMEAFVRRQISEWGSPVDRSRRPRTPIYGSHRIILSTADPGAPRLEERWNLSHWITLNSTQLITNVGRGGSLEQLLPEHIRPEHRQRILDQLARAGRRVMEALAAYEQRAAAAYERESGRPVGRDLPMVSPAT